MNINVDILKSYLPLYNTHYRYKLCISGRSSGKSIQIGRLLLVMAMSKPLRVLCARQIQQSIKDSVHRLLADQIKLLQLDTYFTVTDDAIRGKNGSLFIFRGLYNNLASIKSIENVDIAWLEEAEVISQDAIDILIPTIRKEGSEIWFSMNARYIDDPVYATYYADANGLLNRPDTLVISTSYADNPFNSAEILAEIEYTKQHNYERYLHIYCGHLKTHADAGVFKDKFKVEYFDKTKVIGTRCFGADFGYSNDPNTLIECYIQQKERLIYIVNAVSGIHTEINNLPDLWKKIKQSNEFRVVADCSRPETISYMRNHGYPLTIGSKKGKGSVNEGIEFLKSYTVIISPELVDVIDEFRKYSYKTNPQTGKITDVLEDANNHFCISENANISTTSGYKHIKDIRIGDKVLTRSGYRTVIDCGKTGVNKLVTKLVTILGNELFLTNNHNIITKSGKVRTDAISYTHQLYSEITLWKTLKLLFTKIKSIIDTKEKNTIAEVTLDFIGRYLLMFMVKYLKDTIYIILTIIQIIMIYPILLVYLIRNILKHILRKRHKSLSIKEKRILLTYDTSQKNGMLQKRELTGIKNTVRTFGSTIRKYLIQQFKYVWNVMRNSLHRLFMTNSVVITASLKTAGKVELIILKRYVQLVDRFSCLINTPKILIVQDHVSDIQNNATKTDVYNITVDIDHEYFAGGILVSNCDAIRYACEDFIQEKRAIVKQASGW